MSESNNTGASVFTLIGAGLAGYLSWTTFHSVFWAAWDAIWGWLYVLYFVIRYGVPK